MRTHRLLEGDLWAERDAQNRGETERMMRELRDNLLGEYVWNNLQPAAHSSVSVQRNVSPLRDDVLGIGKGCLVSQLVRSRFRASGGLS